jgi:hypothetical protein
MQVRSAGDDSKPKITTYKPESMWAWKFLLVNLVAIPIWIWLMPIPANIVIVPLLVLTLVIIGFYYGNLTLELSDERIVLKRKFLAPVAIDRKSIKEIREEGYYSNKVTGTLGLKIISDNGVIFINPLVFTDYSNIKKELLSRYGIPIANRE